MINKINIDSVNMQIDSIVKDMSANFLKSGNICTDINSMQSENSNASFSIESLLRQEKK